MKRMYLIRTQDIFDAIGNGQLSPDQSFMEAGTLWSTLALTDEERARYTYPIREL